MTAPPLHALIYLDVPKASRRRAALRAAHLRHVAASAQDLKAAGPLLDAQDQACGSLLIFQTDDVSAIEALAAGDPYVVEKIVETVRILRWDPLHWALPGSLDASRP